MKTIRYILLVMAGAFLFHSCNDEHIPGVPGLSATTDLSTAMFGDSLAFSANVAEGGIALSTLKAQLFYGDEQVSETVIRTKTEGEYSGKIFVPFMANIPNGKTTLKLVLQDINLAITEIDNEITLSRPDFPYLTLVSEETDDDGNNIEYRMERTDLYQYSVTGRFPQKVKSYIKSPKMGENGNEIMFGWESGVIKEGTTTSISFSNSSAGEYTIRFNTFSYEAELFVKLLVNDKEMEMVDDNNYQVDLTLTNGQQVTMSGFPDLEEWWLDPDFFKEENDVITFVPISGSYRITANYTHQYFIVEVLRSGELATLQSDGTGAIWVIGEKIGKPSLNNAVGWTTEKALCMSPVAKGKYQITVVGGKSIGTTGINFKFFHQKGWGGEYTQDKITSNSDIIVIPKSDGNLAIVEGKALDELGIYRLTVDVTAGIDKAVLTVDKVGEETAPEFSAVFDGTDMEKVDAENYKVEKTFAQGQQIAVGGIDDMASWWIDPDYFTLGQDGKLTFLPISGKYRVTANVGLKYFNVEVMSGDDTATLQADGTGAVWIIGDDTGKPSLSNQIGWDAGKALCMAPLGNKKYQLTLEAGVNMKTTSINFKFFHQKGWGGEFGGGTFTCNSDIVFVGDGTNGRDPGNLGVVDGKSFTDGKLYVFTLDLSAGNDNGVLTVTEL